MAIQIDANAQKNKSEEEKQEYVVRNCARAEHELLPEFSAELEEIRKNGITLPLLYDILRKHFPNSEYNRKLYRRYMGITNGIPIFGRQPRYKEDKPINNKVNNDFFGEIVDFKVGYFAGEPIAYGYSDTDEAEETTGGEKAVKEANKILTDFITRNNMFGVDMETTKYASIYGYSGRLFYIKDGEERVMPIHGYETIILSDIDISEPEYAIRYYKSLDLYGAETWTVEFYDNAFVTIYKGKSLYSLEEVEQHQHFFDFCPLQGIANNKEHIGDAEKVLALIDDYDKVVSDNSNEIESFVHALMLVMAGGDNTEEVLQRANQTGILQVPPVGSNAVNEPVKWVTKNINDAFTEHHLQRVEDNIYRFSRTPNLGDESFGSASGVSLKFKLHGLETKCATYEACVMNSAQHMWRVLCSAWAKKNKHLDPLQITMEFKRNFPQDDLTTAQTVQAEIASGAPKKFAFRHYTDDPEYLIEMVKAEKEDSMELFEEAQQMATNGNFADKETDDTQTNPDDTKNNQEGKEPVKEEPKE